MPRIRTIKPEFPHSETIGKLSREARLLFVQLFTIVDDAGRTRAAPRMLASLLYPYDDDAFGLIDGWLAELATHGAVRRYEVRGAQYLEIVKWLDHQKIDRATPSRLPAAPGRPGGDDRYAEAYPYQARSRQALGGEDDIEGNRGDSGDGTSDEEGNERPPLRPATPVLPSPILWLSRHATRIRRMLARARRSLARPREPSMLT